MNEKINWGRVLARPQVDIPQQAVLDYEKSNEKTEGLCEKNWGKLWVSNLKSNVKTVGDLDKYGIYRLTGTFKGETAYLFGGGPSLKYNIMDFKGKGRVFTSTHSLKFLVSKGIKVNYCGVVDAYARQAKWADIGSDSKDMTLLMDINCHPGLLKVWKGNVIFFRTVGKGEGLSKVLWDLSPMEHLVRSGGNVMTALLGCAHIMGFKKFVFAGHDYCNEDFTQFVQYADGTEDHGRHVRIPKHEKFKDALIDINIEGRGVVTLARMWFYKFWTESFAKHYSDCEFINATEGGILGAYPEGNLSFIKQMRLSEV